MTSITDFWYMPTIVPIAITTVIHIGDQYVMKARDFIKEANLLEDTNKIAKIEALKEFVEHQFNSKELDGTIDSFKKIVSEFTRRSRHDLAINFYRKVYKRTEVVVFLVMWIAVAALILSLIFGNTAPDSRAWWLIVGIGLTMVSLVSVAILYVFTGKLSKISQQEDLR